MTYYEKKEIKELGTFIPDKMWFSLKECCALKGLNYKTICNKPHLEPNNGNAEIVCGRKMFRRDELMKWLLQVDDDLSY